MLQRWSKLERDFRMKNGRYDISKIPDIYDCVKYDVIHNATLGLEDTLELFRLSRALADIVIPQVRFSKIEVGCKMQQWSLAAYLKMVLIQFILFLFEVKDFSFLQSFCLSYTVKMWQHINQKCILDVKESSG